MKPVFLASSLCLLLFLLSFRSEGQDREEQIASLSGELTRKSESLNKADPEWNSSLERFLETHAIHGLGKSDVSSMPKSEALARAAFLISEGSPEMARLWKDWNTLQSKEGEVSETSSVKWLAERVDTGADKPEKMLAGVVPDHWIYRGLVQVYRALSSKKMDAVWKPLPMPEGDEIVKAGETYSAAGDLAMRLKEGGYLGKEISVSEGVFSNELSEALKWYQEDQGLKDDGIIGPNTLEGLNRTVKDRLDSLSINLERSRLLPKEAGNRHIIVNLPSGNLFAFESGSLRQTMKIVFGKTGDETSTRIFADHMSTVVFRPYWNIPVGIAAEEIVPEARKNPGYLSQKGYEIVPEYQHEGNQIQVSAGALNQVESGDLFLRQRPGPENALGLVKFLFPNDHAIYLHDTPNDSLFSRSTRTFSHGCIRVERPADLAEWVLGPEGWDGAKVAQALSEGNDQKVALTNDVKVYIVYLTALPLVDGESDLPSTTVRYYRDVYERDPVARKELSGIVQQD